MKKNHPRFYCKVDNLFYKAGELNYQSMLHRHFKSTNYDHSRLEEREDAIFPSMYLLRYQKEWQHLQLWFRV